VRLVLLALGVVMVAAEPDHNLQYQAGQDLRVRPKAGEDVAASEPVLYPLHEPACMRVEQAEQVRRRKPNHSWPEWFGRNRLCSRCGKCGMRREE
jgi:hypothetical protein